MLFTRGNRTVLSRRLVSFVAGWVTLCIPLVAVGGDQEPTLLSDGNSQIWEFDQSVDANQLDMLMTNFGVYGHDFGNMEPGLFYPTGTDKPCLYQGGLWIGGYVGEELRLSVSAMTGFEFQPGQILPSGGWTEPTDPAYRVYKLTPDSGPGDADYDEWPVDQGAPLGPDNLPLRAGDQTLFSVFHDANPAGHWAVNGGTEPIGVEVRHLTYAYDLPEPLARVIVMDLEMEHKGEEALQSAFVGVALDAEIGFDSDDVAGSDPDLGTSFAYNGQDVDPIYGINPPALGVVFLDGPADLYAAVDWTPVRDPASAQESYNYLRGLDRNGDPVIDPTNGNETRFWHSGDPVSGQGWLDTDPADKRILLSAGPFDFAPGQTTVLRVALVVGQGWTHIEGVQDLKQAIAVVRDLNDKGAFPSRSRWAMSGFYPNPFCLGPAPEARGFVVAPREGRARAFILDTAGSLVRRLASQPVDPGITALAWDGTDDNGNPVAPGDYRILFHVFEYGHPIGAVVWDATWLTVDCIGGGEEPDVDDDYATTPPLPDGLTGKGGPLPGLRVPSVMREGGWITVEAGRAPAFGGHGTDVTEISIFNVLGKRVRGFRWSDEGSRRIWWDGRDGQGRKLSSGLYLVRYERGARTATGRVLLIR
jgi:hypothetical protein